jgi:hypothetical protein
MTPGCCPGNTKRGVDAQNAAFTYEKCFSLPGTRITIAPACWLAKTSPEIFKSNQKNF